MKIHEYPSEGLKMPTFVTNDVQMVIEVNYGPGDKYSIGYRSVGEKVGPRIPRTKAKTSTVATPLKPYDIDVSPNVPSQTPGSYGYRPPSYGGTASLDSSPSRPGFESPGLFGRVPPAANQPRTPEKTNDRFQDSKTDQSTSHQGKNEALEESDQKPESKKSKNSVILGLLWTVAIVVVIAGVSIVVYMKYKDEFDSIRRRTEQRLEAKL